MTPPFNMIHITWDFSELLQSPPQEQGLLHCFGDSLFLFTKNLSSRRNFNERVHIQGMRSRNSLSTYTKTPPQQLLSIQVLSRSILINNHCGVENFLNKKTEHLGARCKYPFENWLMVSLSTRPWRT